MVAERLTVRGRPLPRPFWAGGGGAGSKAILTMEAWSRGRFCTVRHTKGGGARALGDSLPAPRFVGDLVRVVWWDTRGLCLDSSGRTGGGTVTTGDRALPSPGLEAKGRRRRGLEGGAEGIGVLPGEEEVRMESGGCDLMGEMRRD